MCLAAIGWRFLRRFCGDGSRRPLLGETTSYPDRAIGFPVLKILQAGDPWTDEVSALLSAVRR